MLLVFGFKVVEHDPREVGNDDVAGNFVVLAFAEEGLDVFKGLGLRLTQVVAERLVLDDEVAFPEQVDEAVVAGDLLTGASKEATALRETPKTSKNSFQKVCLSADSVRPLTSRWQT